jgi:threonine synthase
VVCVLTGHLLKDPDAIKGEVIEIEPTLDALDVILSREDGEGSVWR